MVGYMIGATQQAGIWLIIHGSILQQRICTEEKGNEQKNT